MPVKQKDFEERELEQMIRAQAERARKLQQTITEGQDMEKWVSDGNLEYLERRIFSAIERKAFQTLKAPDFDPASVSHVAQLKALCQSLDLIRGEIMRIVSDVQQARALLQNLEEPTRKDGE
jgi:hypothetical protein